MTGRNPHSVSRGSEKRADRPCDRALPVEDACGGILTPKGREVASLGESHEAVLANYVEEAQSDETVLAIPFVSPERVGGATSYSLRRVVAREYALRSKLWDEVRAVKLCADSRQRPCLVANDQARVLEYIRPRVAVLSPCEDDPDALSYIGKPSVELLNSAGLQDDSVYFLLALPGMGKSTVSTTEAYCIDLDYGNWRREHGESKDHLSLRDYMEQLSAFMDHVAEEVLRRRKTVSGPLLVMSNEVDLLPFCEALQCGVTVVVPAASFISDWLGGIRRRELIKPTLREGRYATFADKAEDRWFSWWCDWTNAARVADARVIQLDTWITADLLRRKIPVLAHQYPDRNISGPKDGAEPR